MSNNARRFAVFAFCLGTIFHFGSSAFAEDVAYSAAYQRCMEGAIATFAMMDCGTEEISRWDKRLNDNYKLLLPKLSASQKKALIDSEVAWVKFRDTNCAFWANPEGGTSARLAGNSCYLELTARRAQELGVALKMNQ